MSSHDMLGYLPCRQHMICSRANLGARYPANTPAKSLRIAIPNKSSQRAPRTSVAYSVRSSEEGALSDAS